MLLAAVAMCTFAAAPNGSGTYYQNANGKKGAALKTALCGIIYNRTEKSYDYLWTAFRTTDKRSDGKVWDMYSNITNFTFGTDQAGNYQEEGDVYNREHSFPKSWFGGEVKPMYFDLHHMYPTDGYVNNKRSNFPFGETNSPTYTSENDFSKLGPCSYSGYTGTVFEPNDMYKGDFARTYFYMVTCYEEKLADWYSKNSESRATIDGTKYPAFQTWQLNMLMEWAAADPVSEKEINRNNAVYGIQNNRNPFIDYPGLEQYIWGSKTDVAFSYDNYEGSGSGTGGDPDPGTDPGDDSNYFVKITSMNDLESGGTYLIVYENGSKAFNGALTTLDVAENNISVTISDHKIEATQTVMASTFTITAKTGGYSVKSASGKYIGNANQSSNGLSSLDSDSYTNIIEFQTSTGNVFIKCNSTRLNFNPQAGQSRFRYYSGGLQEIQLYKLIESTNPSLTSSDLALTGAPIALDFDLSNNASAQTVSYTTSSTGAVTVSGGEGYVTTSVNESTKTITVAPLAKTTSPQTITVSQAADETYEAGSVTFTVTVGDSTPVPSSGGWVETPFASLTSSDIFVIVGTNSKGSFAMSNDKGESNPPTAVAVTVADGKITSDVADNIKWKISGNATNGYTFYPNGSTTTWLYCNTTAKSGSNDNMRVGDGDRKTFIMGDNNYLVTKDSYTQRIVGIYNSQHWRAYTVMTDNIVNQTFAFYKYVAPSAPTSIPVFVSELGCGTFASDYALDFSASEIRAFYATESGDNLIFHEVEKVPANTGVLLYKVGGASDDIPVYNGTTDAVTGNAFVRGTGAAVSYSETDKNYILFDGDDGLGFYKANNNPVATDRAYIHVPVSVNVKCFLLDLENDPTGIRSMEEVRGMMEDGVIYNLAGQRLQKMQKGINIVNGKKVLR